MYGDQNYFFYLGRVYFTILESMWHVNYNVDLEVHNIYKVKC